METKKDFTEVELNQIKKNNRWYYDQIINNSADYYSDGGYFKDRNEDHKVVGITNERLQSVIKDIQSEKFAYSRSRDYGITIYHIDNESPTGVSSVNGISNEFLWLVDLISRSGTLSPTEGLQTAR